jgi:hypothetical protein
VLTVNGGHVKRGDLEADNGLVHVVDRVLYPPVTKDLFETLKSDPEKRFTTLIKALKATKLDKEIQNYSSKSGREWTFLNRTFWLKSFRINFDLSITVKTFVQRLSDNYVHVHMYYVGTCTFV